MRLINVHTRRLETFQQDPTKPYAILSHTWGKDGDELSFQDLQAIGQEDVGQTTKLAKLDGCCAQAKREGIDYVWIDTCCIDKTNSVELGEAINSMFRWYQKSTICYTYLSDIQPGQPRESIADSRWFTRGWTLQELLASRRITFFDSSWAPLGTKSSLSRLVGQATGIPHHILAGIFKLETSSIAQRMSWASKRTTTKPEDMAYCLLGIFEVMIPPLYGEGLEAAFERLQEATMKKNHDGSILAWSLGRRERDKTQYIAAAISGGVLATSPADFAGCGDIVQQQSQTAPITIQPSEKFGGMMGIGISIRPPDSEPDALGRVQYGYLPCGPQSDSDCIVAIPLVECHAEPTSGDGPPVFIRPRGLNAICMRKPPQFPARQDILIRKYKSRDEVQLDDKSHWIYLPEPYPWNAEIEEVHPAKSFESEMAMIKTSRVISGGKPFELFLARFSCHVDPDGNEKETPGHFILGLEFFQDSATGVAIPQAYLYFLDDEKIPLSEIAGIWTSLACSSTTEINLASPPVSLRVSLRREEIARQYLWVVCWSNNPLSTTSSLPRFPPGWPEISQQFLLRRQGRDLVRCLRDHATLEWESRKLGNKLKHRDAEINAISQSIQDATNQIAILEAQVKHLRSQSGALEALQKRTRVRLETVHGRLSTADREIMRIERDQAAILSPVPDVLQPGAVATPQWLGWGGAIHRDREGLAAYLMEFEPIKISGKEIGWVDGMTLLMYAAASGDIDLLRRVVRHDGDVFVADSNGQTALDWAILSGSEPCRGLLQGWMGIGPRQRRSETVRSLPSIVSLIIPRENGVQGATAGIATTPFQQSEGGIPVIVSGTPQYWIERVRSNGSLPQSQVSRITTILGWMVGPKSSAGRLDESGGVHSGRHVEPHALFESEGIVAPEVQSPCEGIQDSGGESLSC